MQVNIIGSDQFAKVSARLDNYAYRSQQTQPVMEEIAMDMLRVEGIVFSSGGRRGGGVWRKLKESTVNRKDTREILRTRYAKPGYGVGNDALFKSVTMKGANYQILNITRRGIEFGTSVPGAATQQLGSAKMGVPRRPFLRFLASDVARWERMIAESLLAGRR